MSYLIVKSDGKTVSDDGDEDDRKIREGSEILALFEADQET